MADTVKELFTSYHNPNKSPPKEDLNFRYCEVAKHIRPNSPVPAEFWNLLRTILAQHAKDRGELVVAVNGTKAHFEKEGKAFTNFGIILLSVIQVHFLDHIRYDLELLVWGQSLPSKVIRLEAKKLHSGAWIDDLGPKYIYEKWGIGNLKILIQAMAQCAPVKDEYRYSGWAIDDNSIYIMNGKQINGDSWDKTVAKVSCIHTLEMLNVAPHSVTIPLLAIALLSLVQSQMMILGEYFKGVCCITAPSQSFKTTLAALFFDFENGREATSNFEATMAAIVRTVGNARDSTVIVDDFKPGATKTEHNEMIRKLSTVIRMCGDNSGGIQKAGNQNSIISNASHGLVVVTAEHMQLSVQSTLARLLILEMNRGSIDETKLPHFQSNHGAYRDFIQYFIQYIASMRVDKYCEKLVQRFLQERNTLRNELLAKDIPVDNRASDMVTWLWISFGKFLNYAQKVEAISSEQLTAYEQEAHTVFLVLMEQQAERVADLAPVRQFFQGLQVLLDTKEARIGELQARNTGFAVSDSKDAIGFSKKGYIYLKNGVAIQAVASYYRRFGKDFTISEPVLRKALADSGYIVKKTEKSYIHRLSVNHESYQCIAFEEKTFRQLLQGGRTNGAETVEELPGDRALRKNADAILGRGD